MTKQEAQDAYRQAWTGWCFATEPSTKKLYETRMDGLQSSITRGPGPEWTAFAETLPGFLEYWGGWKKGILAKVQA